MRLARLAPALLVLAALLAAPTTRAVDVGDGQLSIHGDGTWSYQRTDANRYGPADPDGEWNTSIFDLVLTARPADAVVLAAQVGWDGDEAALEWGFAEWRAADAFRLRAGKVKQPLGNYAEIQFVGTARPFLELPTSVYGPAEIAATSYSGVGATGELPLGQGAFALQYDVYGGAVELQTLEPFDVLQPGAPGGPVEPEDVLVENIVGGRLSLVTPWDLTLRASGFGGRTETDEGETLTLAIYGLSAWYRGERVWVSAEAFRAQEVGFEDRLSGYVEAAVFVHPRVQLAVRYEAARVDLEDVSGGSPLLRHDEWGAGASFWITPGLVARASVHGARGARFVLPDEDGGTAAERTLRVVAGVQYTF